MAEIQFEKHQRRGLYYGLVHGLLSGRSQFALDLVVTEHPQQFTYEDFFTLVQTACKTLGQLDSQLATLSSLPISPSGPSSGEASGNNLELRALRGRPPALNAKSNLEELLLLEGETIDIPPSLKYESLSKTELETALPFTFLLRTEFARFEGKADIIHKVRVETRGLEPGVVKTLGQALELVPARFKRLRIGLEGFRSHFFGSMAGLAPVVSEKSYLEFEPGKLTASLEIYFAQELSDIKAWMWLKNLVSKYPDLASALNEIETRIVTSTEPELSWRQS